MINFPHKRPRFSRVWLRVTVPDRFGRCGDDEGTVSLTEYLNAVTVTERGIDLTLTDWQIAGQPYPVLDWSAEYTD